MIKVKEKNKVIVFFFGGGVSITPETSKGGNEFYATNMTAWMLYQLKDDEEASKVFIGEDAELLNNKNWQDVEKNK